MNTKYKHLNCEERTLIQLSLERGCTLRAIALSLDRNQSSVSRELLRNGWCNPKAVHTNKPVRPVLAGGYRAAPDQLRAHTAQTTAHKPARLAIPRISAEEWWQLMKLGSDSADERRV